MKPTWETAKAEYGKHYDYLRQDWEPFAVVREGLILKKTFIYLKRLWKPDKEREE